MLLRPRYPELLAVVQPDAVESVPEIASAVDRYAVVEHEDAPERGVQLARLEARGAELPRLPDDDVRRGVPEHGERGRDRIGAEPLVPRPEEAECVLILHHVVYSHIWFQDESGVREDEHAAVHPDYLAYVRISAHIEEHLPLAHGKPVHHLPGRLGSSVDIPCAIWGD